MIAAWIVIGAILGVVWEWFSTTYSPSKNRSTLLPSLIIHRGKKAFHLHHWVFYFGCILAISVWSFSNEPRISPIIVAVNTFFLSAMLYNFKKYPDWYRFW